MKAANELNKLKINSDIELEQIVDFMISIDSEKFCNITKAFV